MVKAANDAELKKACTSIAKKPSAKSSALNRYSR